MSFYHFNMPEGAAAAQLRQEETEARYERVYTLIFNTAKDEILHTLAESAAFGFGHDRVPVNTATLMIDAFEFLHAEAILVDLAKALTGKVTPEAAIKSMGATLQKMIHSAAEGHADSCMEHWDGEDV